MMAVRMELDVDTAGGEAPQLLFVHDLEQVLTFDFIKRDAEGLRQLSQELEPFVRRQLRAEFLRRLLGVLRLAFQVESSEAAWQIDQLGRRPPEQVRNRHSVNRHPVLDIISRYIDRDRDSQFPNDREPDRINSAPAIIHSYNRGTGRKTVRSQGIQRISQGQNRVIFAP